MIPAFIAAAALAKDKGEEHEMRIGDEGIYRYPDMTEDDDEEEVLQSKGGKSPRPPDPMATAQAQNYLAQQEAAREEQARIAQEQREAQERAQLVARAGSAQQGEFDRASGMWGDLGAGYNESDLERYGIQKSFNNTLQGQRSGWAEDQTNVSLNAEQAFADAVSGAAGRRRGDLSNQWGDMYGDDYAYESFKDTADDQYINSILDTRQGDAMAMIDDALARGQLNQGGYTRAMTEFDNQKTLANAQLQNSGQDILGDYRGQLDKYSNKQLGSIDNLGFNDRYSIDNAETGLDRLVSRLGGQLEGDLLTQTAGQTYFDPNTAISKGGTMQGYYNPSAPTNAGENAASDENLANRQQSTNGVF